MKRKRESGGWPVPDRSFCSCAFFAANATRLDSRGAAIVNSQGRKPLGRKRAGNRSNVRGFLAYHPLRSSGRATRRLARGFSLLEVILALAILAGAVTVFGAFGRRGTPQCGKSPRFDLCPVALRRRNGPDYRRRQPTAVPGRYVDRYRRSGAIELGLFGGRGNSERIEHNGSVGRYGHRTQGIESKQTGGIHARTGGWSTRP